MLALLLKQGTKIWNRRWMNDFLSGSTAVGGRMKLKMKIIWMTRKSPRYRKLWYRRKINGVIVITLLTIIFIDKHHEIVFVIFVVIRNILWTTL